MHIETRQSRAEVTYLGKDNSAPAEKRKPEASASAKGETENCRKLQGGVDCLRRAWPWLRLCGYKRQARLSGAEALGFSVLASGLASQHRWQCGDPIGAWAWAAGHGARLKPPDPSRAATWEPDLPVSSSLPEAQPSAMMLLFIVVLRSGPVGVQVSRRREIFFLIVFILCFGCSGSLLLHSSFL